MSNVHEQRPEGPLTAVRPSAALAGEQKETVAADVLARVADFAALTNKPGDKPTDGVSASLDRLLDVTVTVSAELGRITLPISSLLSLNVNSVLELNRTISEPIDLMVQGVRLARAEVVVVGDCFAVRIKEIAEAKQARSGK